MTEYNFNPAEEQKQQICIHCGGKNTQKAWIKNKETGEYDEHPNTACIALTDTSQEAWEEMWFLLKQFIRCPVDNEKGTCEGCEYEREEFMSHVYHYAILVKGEDGTLQASTN